MKISTFEQELKQINRDLAIQSNITFPGLAGVYFKGEYLFAIPDNDIYDDVRQGYFIVIHDGRQQRHRTRIEALGMAKAMIDQMNDNDHLDAVMGTGKYSKEALKDEPNKIITPDNE